MLVRGTGHADQLGLWGDSNDIYRASGGDDSVSGGLGDDQLFGDRGNDAMNGDEGSDQLFGGRGNDLLYDVDGSNKLAGGWGDDAIYGAGALLGASGHDYLSVFAGYGNGGSGNDSMVAGEPVLSGTAQAGQVTLIGGTGDDAFTVYAAADGVSTRTDILDFGNGADSLGVCFMDPIAGAQDGRVLLDVNFDHHLNAADGLLVDAEGLHITIGDDQIVLHGQSDFVF